MRSARPNRSARGLSLYLRKGVHTNAQIQASPVEHEGIVEALRDARVADASEALEARIPAGRQRMLDTVSHPAGR